MDYMPRIYIDHYNELDDDLDDKENIIKKCVLCFRGSFDPIHKGHISMLQACKIDMETRGYKVVAVILTPVNDAWGRKNLQPFHHRFEMIKLAVRDYPWIVPTDYQIVGSNKTKKIGRLQDLKHCRNLYPGVDVIMTCGADRFESVVQLFEANDEEDGDMMKILKNFQMLVADRDELCVANILEGYGLVSDKIHILKRKYQACSSTSVRTKIRNDEEIDMLVGKEIAEYIYKNNLYQ